jgi:hypothetical protein
MERLAENIGAEVAIEIWFQIGMISPRKSKLDRKLRDRLGKN